MNPVSDRKEHYHYYLLLVATDWNRTINEASHVTKTKTMIGQISERGTSIFAHFKHTLEASESASAKRFC